MNRHHIVPAVMLSGLLGVLAPGVLQAKSREGASPAAAPVQSQVATEAAGNGILFSVEKPKGEIVRGPIYATPPSPSRGLRSS